MRDPNRISKIMTLLQNIWSTQPDTRFNQLIHNLQFEFFQETKQGTVCYDYVKIPNGGPLQSGAWAIDLFNVEDDLFIQFLEKKYNNLK